MLLNQIRWVISTTELTSTHAEPLYLIATLTTTQHAISDYQSFLQIANQVYLGVDESFIRAAQQYLLDQDVK